MRKFRRIVCAAAAIALLGIFCRVTAAADSKTPVSPEAVLKAMGEAGQPGSEHKKLEPLVGDWTFTLKMWTDPSQPPAELTGTVNRKWIMGGRFVQETVNGQCNLTGKTFEGLGLVGYHGGEKKFTFSRACGLCGTAACNLATLDASGQKFSCATEECCPLSGERFSGRDEVIIENNDRIVTNVYKTQGGKEAKVMEIVSLRRK
jgi:hypothetical protein